MTNATKAAHTPGPWHADKGNDAWTASVHSDHESVADVFGSGSAGAQANAQMIAHAVNCHADLVAELEACEATLDALLSHLSERGSLHRKHTGPFETRLEAVHAALTKAKATR